MWVTNKLAACYCIHIAPCFYFSLLGLISGSFEFARESNCFPVHIRPIKIAPEFQLCITAFTTTFSLCRWKYLMEERWCHGKFKYFIWKNWKVGKCLEIIFRKEKVGIHVFIWHENIIYLSVVPLKFHNLSNILNEIWKRWTQDVGWSLMYSACMAGLCHLVSFGYFHSCSNNSNTIYWDWTDTSEI